MNPTIGFAAGDLAGGVGYYRGRVPCRMVQEAGRNVGVGGSVTVPIGGGAIALVEAADYPSVGVEETGPGWVPHVIVLSGVLPHRVRAGGIRAAQSDGQAVIVDIDDTLTLPDWHPHYDPAVAQARRDAIAAADVVTVGTDEIADELNRLEIAARPPIVCPNVLDLSELGGPVSGPPPFADGSLCIGYRGPVEFHRGDLDMLGEAFRWIYERLEGQVRFRHVGGEPGTFAEAVGLPESLVDVRPVRPFDRFMRDLPGCDVAVIPHAPTRYNRAKGAQAALEWTLSGVPWIASPHPAIAALCPPGPFATTPTDWLARIEPFAERPKHRDVWWLTQLRAAAPRLLGFDERLRADLDVPRERVTGQWLTAIDQAVMRRGRVAPI